MKNQTSAVEWLKNEMPVIDWNDPYWKIKLEKAKEMERNQRWYTKEDVLKAGEIGEINHHDYKHIVKLLDEARQINETYGSKGSYELSKVAENTSFDTTSQTEISDKEIEEQVKYEINYGGGSEGWIRSAWVRGAKWYREQLKKKQ